MTLAASNIAELELMIRVIKPQIMIFLHGPTPRLTKSLVHFQIQSFVLGTGVRGAKGIASRETHKVLAIASNL
jgi:hypothetical protein